MLFSAVSPIIAEAEQSALKGGKLSDVLRILRRLSMDNFGELLFSMPNGQWPALSQVLPAMAPADVQKTWTGQSGFDLLKQTVAFARQIENNVYRMGKDPRRCQFLDFGCGYGRFIRMLYYFADAHQIWGVDAWQKSLDQCVNSGIEANLALSDIRPADLPVEGAKFDVAFAFSIFTHLPRPTAEAALSAVRKHIADDGCFILTIRPVEYWTFRDGRRGTHDADRMQAEHNDGYAYIPQNSAQAADYGEASMPMEFFNRLGWKVTGYDTTLHDAYQVSVILKPE